MAELRVISKFTVTVFEDGTYKTEKILLEGVNSRKMIQGKNEPSARIVQIIDTLKEIKKMYEEYYSENKAEAAFAFGCVREDGKCKMSGYKKRMTGTYPKRSPHVFNKYISSGDYQKNKSRKEMTYGKSSTGTTTKIKE